LAAERLAQDVGWGARSREHATPALFGVLDGFVRRRLRAILRKQEKRPGFGRCQADHQRWPNVFFAAHGLFTLRTAYEQARHSRWGNQRLDEAL